MISFLVLISNKDFWDHWVLLAGERPVGSLLIRTFFVEVTYNKVFLKIRNSGIYTLTDFIRVQPIDPKGKN